jgi:hypothetical protein
MMVTVAIAGLVMGWAVHARDISHEEDDVGYGMFVVECIGRLVLLLFALPIVFVINLVRQDEVYVARLRRDDRL